MAIREIREDDPKGRDKFEWDEGIVRARIHEGGDTNASPSDLDGDNDDGAEDLRPIWPDSYMGSWYSRHATS